MSGWRKWFGKSTLIKILTGAFSRTSGTILLNGMEYVAYNPRDAKQKGVSTLFQELNVVDQLTVEENLTLGLEDTRFGFLRKTDKIKKMVKVLEEHRFINRPQTTGIEVECCQKTISRNCQSGFIGI